MQLFQMQQQHAADQRREDRRDAAAREERLEALSAEREASLEPQLLQAPSTPTVGSAATAALKSNKAFDTLTQ